MHERVIKSVSTVHSQPEVQTIKIKDSIVF